jgi:microcin C transport system ATP-binding protein
LRVQILGLLADLQRQTGMAVLLITHDLNLVRKFADRVAVMEDGHLVEQGAVAEVFAAPQHPYTRKLIDSRPARDVDEGAGGAAGDAAPAHCGGYPVPIAGFAGGSARANSSRCKGADFSIPPAARWASSANRVPANRRWRWRHWACCRTRARSRPWASHWTGRHRGGPGLRRQVQVVFQDPFSSLSPRMTVEEIVGEGLLVHEPGLPLAARRDRVLQALADVGLSEAQFPGLLDAIRTSSPVGSASAWPSPAR